MAFTPENELEKAMLYAASQESVRPMFYRLLLDSELWAIGELGEAISIETVENEGVRYHPVFTSQKRLADFVSTQMPTFTMPGRALFQATRGARFVINPGSEVGKTLTPEEITWFLDVFHPRDGDLVVTQPKVLPKTLLKALCVLFTSRSLIRAAHLVHVRRDGIDMEPHPMIGLEADGDVPRLAQEIIEAAEAVFPGKPIEIIYIDPNGPLHPLQKHLLGVPPFYKRTLTTN